jgi:hypothetical protein
VTVSVTAGASPLAKLGFVEGQVIQEFGYDDDVDDDLRIAIEELVGGELEDEDFNDGADGVIAWYRDGDDDLADLMVDAITKLFDAGFVVLFTPKAGRPGYVQASDIEEAASTSGLVTGSPVNASKDWAATRLMPPKGVRR